MEQQRLFSWVTVEREKKRGKLLQTVFGNKFLRAILHLSTELVEKASTQSLGVIFTVSFAAICTTILSANTCIAM